MRKFNKKNFIVDRASISALFCAALIVAGGCSNTPTVSNLPAANTNAQSGAMASPSPAPSRAAAPSGASQGDPIDTSKYDAEIARAEQELKKKPEDEKVRMAMAHAYLARASALTKARQYRSALGDYRRTLRYDPDNRDAREMSATIVGILETMKRGVPAEGEEPPPLPLKKDGQQPEAGNLKKSD